ncbi:Protein of unknown function [Natronoarchaeum philippinense]|uniref:Uncharacterized protein n=1 Tax=Natronoarchaeum philippinense TaxID=558529 RepID=A0A285N3M5_NATPI|nr:DUF3006 family protein [Natronoarchaeum philippinense]SNZ03928.1 Protein of unknown function [Natronoarchaeum philippinense]
MTLLTRRELVATLASMAGSVLPFGFGGNDRRNDPRDNPTAGESATLTGVVDRIERGDAVVLLERADEVIGQRLVSTDRLPDDAREAGAVLSILFEDGEIQRLRHDLAATRRRRRAAEERFEDLEEGP